MSTLSRRIDRALLKGVGLGIVALLSFACVATGSRGVPTPIPPDLPTTPTPEGSVFGGLEGLYRTDTPPNPNQPACFDFLRLYEDGIVLFANACLNADTGTGKIQEWLQRDNPDVVHGTYWTSDDQIWMELPTRYLNNEFHLTDMRGRFCADSLALQKMARYAQFPMSVSDPVTKYIRLDATAADPACHVASFYFLITLPGTSGGPLDLIVQTSPGEVCSLTYQNPDEFTPFADDLSTIADSEGKCIWEISLPENIRTGTGQAAVTVGGVTKVVEVRIDK